MGLIIILVAGGILGWLASIFMRTDAEHNIALDIIVGVGGAFVGAWLASSLGLSADLASFHPIGLSWAFVGALLLLGLANFVRRGRLR